MPIGCKKKRVTCTWSHWDNIKESLDTAASRWVSPRTGLEAVAKRKSLPLLGIEPSLFKCCVLLEGKHVNLSLIIFTMLYSVIVLHFYANDHGLGSRAEGETCLNLKESRANVTHSADTE